jgi:hypothetical protein
MPQYYYGTKSALDWVISHYFYRKIHYTYLANCFYPYNQGNPKSSNPLLNYQDLYQPWKDADDFDKFISSSRVNLINGIKAKEKEGVVDAALGLELREICNKISVTFFYPVVLRVDIDRISPARRIVQNSGLRGSSEYTIRDLEEKEFDLLFLDFEGDADFTRIITSVVRNGAYVDSYEARDILERRKSAGP